MRNLKHLKEGLTCPSCGSMRVTVVEIKDRLGYIYRRRKCQNCGTKITTHERVVADGDGENE